VALIQKEIDLGIWNWDTRIDLDSESDGVDGVLVSLVMLTTL
ncbi:hypothetical protein Tco_0782085, partial [Tanacetum coccineum]